MPRSPLARKEAGLAYALLLPALAVVLSIVLLPVLANFWISFKAVELSDLRPPKPIVKLQLRQWPKNHGDPLVIRYSLRNSSQKLPVNNILSRQKLPAGMLVQELDSKCVFSNNELRCEFDHWPAGYREKIQNVFITDDTFITSKKTFKQSNIEISGEAENILTSFQFTLKNYIKIFTNPEFFFVLKTTFLYTLLGTLGSLFLGLFAAQLLNQHFAGRNFSGGFFSFLMYHQSLQWHSPGFCCLILFQEPSIPCS